MLSGIILYQTTSTAPFDINQLHLVVALSRHGHQKKRQPAGTTV